MDKPGKLINLVVLLLMISFAGIRSLADCETGANECSDSGYVLRMCEDGDFREIHCMRDRGMLCEDGECVLPWEYGSPDWPKAEDEPRATEESLAEKAANYEDYAGRLHLHPELKWIMGVELPCMPIDCEEGEDPPCEDCSEPAVPLEEATWRDVVRWRSGENDGLWNALHIAAEAFRYSVTGEPQSLEMIKTLLEGEVIRMEITGVPGLFTRQYIPPGVPGIECPTNKSSYMRDYEKDDNKWVKAGDGGCVWYVDDGTGEWVKSEHCGLEKYAGWCWLDNVSKDEYSGHMFALGVAGELVDDPDVQETVRGLLLKVGRHLVKNGMAFVDWDGRIAEHGRIHAVTFGDYPGFNAAMALSFIKTAAEVTGDPELERWYHDCLLQENGRWNCLRKAFEVPKPYTGYLGMAGLYPGKEGCKANFNNISMHMLSLHNLILFENDPRLRRVYQKHFDEDVFRPAGQPRAVKNQNNALFDFIWAAMKLHGPDSDGPAIDAVENGIRMLRQFPAAKYQHCGQCPEEKCVEYCIGRLGSPATEKALETAESCVSHFAWWRDPYSLRRSGTNRRMVQPPTDYLLAYWMGRYYGFIDADM